MARVSICIPTYKRADLLSRLLDSIEKQSFKDYEIIITDDTPDQSIFEIVEQYSYLPILYHKNNIGLGPAGNWNKSIRLAKGQYIKIVHNDDWFTDSDSLFEYVTLLENNPECDFAFSGSLQVSANGAYSRHIDLKFNNKLKIHPEYLFVQNQIGAPSATIFKNIGIYFDPRLKWLIDVDFYIRYLRKNKKYVFTTKPLISIGVGDDQLTNLCKRDTTILLKEHEMIYQSLELSKYNFCEQNYFEKLFKYDRKLAKKTFKREHNIHYTKLLFILYSKKASSKIKNILGAKWKK